jgi:transcription elongation factor GreA
MSETPISLAEALIEYLQSLKPDQRREYEPFVRPFVDFQKPGTMAGDLSKSQVESYAEQRIRENDPAVGKRVEALKHWFAYMKKKHYTESNLGVQIRAPRSQSPRATTTLPRQEDSPVEMTQAGLVALQEELADLDNQRTELKHAVEVARSDGDLRENAPYHAARESLAFTENRYKQIEETLRRAIVVERRTGDRAAVGSLVKVVNLDDEREFEYRLVSPREANAAERKISVESPVGKELLGRQPGDEVVVTTPRGEVKFRVESVAPI